jgi:hypothetical protein
MKIIRALGRVSTVALAGLGLVWACGFDSTLREYLDARFWLPFSKEAWHFERKNIRRVNYPFAGMVKLGGDTPLGRLRAAYQRIPQPDFEPAHEVPDPGLLQLALTAAHGDKSLTKREREEVDLLDAKIDMRLGEPATDAKLLRDAERKLQVFLRSARTPEFRSEARGWVAHIHYLLGEKTPAGKFYLDELNRNGSNLSRETLLNSLKLTYGYDGGEDLLQHLDAYFDTPEHAAFAIQMVTNPHWNDGPVQNPEQEAKTYLRIKDLLDKHAALLNSNAGSNALAMLGMRTALRMGDPPAALNIAAMVPGDALIRTDPDFEWMLASAHFLSHDFTGAEAPLIALFQSRRASADQKAAAAYALCGVYQKTGNFIEQIRFALWPADREGVPDDLSYPGVGTDLSIYWAQSGWDLNLLLDWEAPDAALEAFLERYPKAEGTRLVRYALAVRYARENRYAKAAEIYDSIHAYWRVPRMRQLAALYARAYSSDLPASELQDARYKLAEFIGGNSARIYFNDQLWRGLQRYALISSSDSRLSGEEREAMMAGERKLKDDQEERWQAYLILRQVVQDSGKTETGRRAARLAIQCLVAISDRFGREEEIRAAEGELTKWLRK